MTRNAQESMPQSPPFSTAVRCGTTVYVSGQGGIDRETKRVVGDDLESQMTVTMNYISEALYAAGLTLRDVVRVTVYLSDPNLYALFNELYERYFVGPYPARTVVYCELNYGLLVEIDVIAVGGEKQFF